MEHFYQHIVGYFDYENVYKAAVMAAAHKCIFVELGVYTGKSTAYLAVEIINSKKDITLITIDNWSWRHDEIAYEYAATVFLKNMEPVRDKVDICLMTYDSMKAAHIFQNNSLNFVYMDTNHEFEHTKQELHLWYPKIMKGGTFAGHDYGENQFGVKKAVDEYVATYNLKLQVMPESSWIIKK